MGTVYMLWAEDTDRFKIGYTARKTADERALALQTGCPFPIRISENFSLHSRVIFATSAPFAIG